jgi:L,D-transpeptidase ErfK/SrfK
MCTSIKAHPGGNPFAAAFDAMRSRILPTRGWYAVRISGGMRMRGGLSLLLISLAVSTAAQRPPLTAAIVGGMSTYEVRSGDTIGSIAARFGTSEAMLIDINRLPHPKALAIGEMLTIDNRHVAMVDSTVAITVNVGQRMLFHYDGARLAAYPVAVGKRGWETPTGVFTVTEKERNPVWDVPMSIQREMEQMGKAVITRMDASAANPLGAHWLRLSFAGIGIHGTNSPGSIYRYSTHGCIRMHPDDVAELFERLTLGATGRSIYEPILIAAIGSRVWMEVHRDEYLRMPGAERYLRAAAERSGLTGDIDWALVQDVIRRRRGVAVDVTARK